jgi:hypothetical protein
MLISFPQLHNRVMRVIIAFHFLPPGTTDWKENQLKVIDQMLVCAFFALETRLLIADQQARGG